jgi:hypothetical protein
VGCTEKKLVFNLPIHETVDIERPTPPDTYPAVGAPQGRVGAVATGLAGLVGGALLGAGYRFAKKLDADEPESKGGGAGDEVSS